VLSEEGGSPSQCLFVGWLAAADNKPCAVHTVSLIGTLFAVILSTPIATSPVIRDVERSM